MPFSKVVVGTWPLSGEFGSMDLKSVQECLEYCSSKGFKEFDTAPIYGNGFSEFSLGKCFNKSSDILLNTKIGNIPFWGKSFCLDDLKKSLEDSLSRLEKASVNVLFLHNPRGEITDYAPVLEFMNDLKKAGKIKGIGLSKAKGFEYEKYVDLKNFDVIQDDASLLYLDSVTEPCPAPVLMARSPLASGILAGLMTPETTFPKDDHRSEWLVGERLNSILRRTEVIQKIVGRGNLATAAKRFVLFHENIDKVIFGIRRQSHIDDLIEDIKKGPLAPAICNDLKAAYDDDFGLINESQNRY
jgi:aryl-alcohol dehydrogenase-like predicted oxidoreductase